jgi:hypothetical protein
VAGSIKSNSPVKDGKYGDYYDREYIIKSYMDIIEKYKNNPILVKDVIAGLDRLAKLIEMDVDGNSMKKPAQTNVGIMNFDEVMRMNLMGQNNPDKIVDRIPLEPIKQKEEKDGNFEPERAAAAKPERGGGTKSFHGNRSPAAAAKPERGGGGSGNEKPGEIRNKPF